MLAFRCEQGVFNYRVAAVLMRRDSLLIHRAPADDFWALPGGRVEFGETSSDALVREFREEIGIRVEVERLLWLVENFFGAPGDPYHEISLYYSVQALDPLPAGPEFPGRTEDMDPPLVFRWQSLATLAEIPLYPTFLASGLRDLPSQIGHIVHRDGSAWPKPRRV